MGERGGKEDQTRDSAIGRMGSYVAQCRVDSCVAYEPSSAQF
jgi:hypothetical protein